MQKRKQQLKKSLQRFLVRNHFSLLFSLHFLFLLKKERNVVSECERDGRSKIETEGLAIKNAHAHKQFLFFLKKNHFQ